MKELCQVYVTLSGLLAIVDHGGWQVAQTFNAHQVCYQSYNNQRDMIVIPTIHCNYAVDLVSILYFFNNSTPARYMHLL